jgi:ubiquitin-protein ligase E3 C
LIVQLAVAPLSLVPPNNPQFTSVLTSLIQHILSIHLLPNRLPIPSISFLASHLQWDQLPPLRPHFGSLVQSLTTDSRIHLLANIYMFVSPQISRLPSRVVGAYLALLATIMINLPINSLDPDAASRRMKLRSQVLADDTDYDSDNATRTTVISVSSFNEPPLPIIDPRSAKRLASVPTAGHITSLFNVAKQSDTALFEYTVFLVSLTITWPSQRDSVLNTVASLGSGGLIRLLYRQYVLRSQLGQQSNNLNGMHTL